MIKKLAALLAVSIVWASSPIPVFAAQVQSSPARAGVRGMPGVATPPGLTQMPAAPISALKVGSPEIRTLSLDLWETLLRLTPSLATSVGDGRYNDRLEDIGPQGRAQWTEKLLEFDARLRSVDPGELDSNDRVSYEVLRKDLDAFQGILQHKMYQFSVDQILGPQVRLLDMVAQTPLKTAEDAEHLIHRFQEHPRYTQQYIENLREGVREGRTSVRAGVLRVIGQLEDILAAPVERSVYGVKIRSMPEDLRQRYEGPALEEVRKSVSPSWRALRDFMKDEYLPAARNDENGGIGNIPGGADIYRLMIRIQTSKDFSSEELHRIGLEELRSNLEEIEALARKMGHTGDLASFFENIRSNPDNFYKTREEVLANAKEQVQRAQERIPRYFGRLPKMPLAVVPYPPHKEKDAPAGFYVPAPADGSRPGVYLVNTYKPESRPKYGMIPLSLHEAVPGHHLQTALAQEDAQAPAVRRFAMAIDSVLKIGFSMGAFREGWGVYVERLGTEMGLYPTDLSKAGMLMYQAWRSIRLVVDTGIHAMGWTRSQAIEFMQRNTFMSKAEIEVEVDRYMIWPGQALAYKVGQLAISALRKEAEERLGPRFEIREFHDVVLMNGFIPLETLERVVREWILRKSEGRPGGT